MHGRMVMARSLSLTLGTTAVTCFVAAAQVWEFTYPRFILGNIGLVLLGSTITLVLWSVVEYSRCENIPFWSSGPGRYLYLPVLVILGFLSLWGPLLAFEQLHVIWPCFDIDAPRICTMRADELLALDAAGRAQEVAALEEMAGPKMQSGVLQFLQRLFGLGG